MPNQFFARLSERYRSAANTPSKRKGEIKFLRAGDIFRTMAEANRAHISNSAAGPGQGLGISQRDEGDKPGRPLRAL